ncbi:MAG: hypothetical protein MUP90_00495 [Gammaproteobacteria bacterium]|nr:hypothetical protein [Gammaproteobacteria bacterium]
MDQCSALAARSGEPLAGTAEPVDCWVMLEFRGIWKSRALEHNDLPARVQGWLKAGVEGLRAKGFKTRPQLIRQQHNRDKDHLSLFVGFADMVEPRLYEFRAANHEEFTTIDVLSLAENGAAYSGNRVSGDRYFVCTNGQRDTCCSLHGMRVYAELAGQCESAAWQTTHLGGHRFAATLVSLPSGAVYGQLQPDDVSSLLKAHAAGALLLPKLRGRSGLDMASQVAEIALRERSGQHQLARYSLLEADSQADIERRVFVDQLDGSRHEIRLQASSGLLQFRAGCSEHELKTRRLYQVLP